MARKPKTVIHVNTHKIRSNKKNNRREAVVKSKTGATTVYGHEAVIYDDHGKEVARLVYRPDKPLPCGAQVWLETHNRVEVRQDVAGNDGPCDSACGPAVRV